MRVYVTGAVSVEDGSCLLTERALPGPLGRHFLACLAANHARSIGHEEIAEELWAGVPPAAWPASLKSIASRVRAAMSFAGLDGAALLVGAPGVYQFRLPADGWVDLDAAITAIHRAETQLTRGAPRDAAADAFVARLISARPLLPGRSGPWLEHARRRLTDVRLRAYACSARAQVALGNAEQAVRDAEAAVELAPLREPGWRLLMDAHAAAGDISSALDAYERCRTVLTDSLGVGPSATTRESHQALLARTG